MRPHRSVNVSFVVAILAIPMTGCGRSATIAMPAVDPQGCFTTGSFGQADRRGLIRGEVEGLTLTMRDPRP